MTSPIVTAGSRPVLNTHDPRDSYAERTYFGGVRCRRSEAIGAYREALALTGNAAEQAFLADRLRSAQATA